MTSLYTFEIVVNLLLSNSLILILRFWMMLTIYCNDLRQRYCLMLVSLLIPSWTLEFRHRHSNSFRKYFKFVRANDFRPGISLSLKSLSNIRSSSSVFGRISNRTFRKVKYLIFDFFWEKITVFDELPSFLALNFRDISFLLNCFLRYFLL